MKNISMRSVWTVSSCSFDNNKVSVFIIITDFMAFRRHSSKTLLIRHSFVDPIMCSVFTRRDSQQCIESLQSSLATHSHSDTLTNTLKTHKQNFIIHWNHVLLGTAPSCCSTPPRAFDDISEGSSGHHRHHDERSGTSERRVHMGCSTIRSTNYREDTIRSVHFLSNCFYSNFKF